MGFRDYIILGIIIILLAFSVLYMRRRKKQGKTPCGGCNGDCLNCAKNDKGKD